MCFIVEQCAGGNCPKTSEMKCVVWKGRLKWLMAATGRAIHISVHNSSVSVKICGRKKDFWSIPFRSKCVL